MRPIVIAMPAPLLIILPHGFNASGVTLWAARLARALAGRGRRIGILTHAEPAGQRRLSVDLPSDVRVFDRPDLPPLGEDRVEHASLTAAYEEAVRDMRIGADPLIVCPNLHGECYGAVAAITTRTPEAIRVVGWQHSDIPYDTQVLAHYEAMLSRMVAVSDAIEHRLRSRLDADRRDDDPCVPIVNIPYGVEVPDSPPAREPVNGRPLRLIYTGRLEHAQKRIGALTCLSDALSQRGVDHELTIVGDGPAMDDVREQARSRPAIRLIGPLPPTDVRVALDAADCFVLASRYEGLSVSLVEAMARGCVPIVTRTRSGAGQAVSPGRNGEIADVPPDATEAHAGEGLADAIVRVLAGDLDAMRLAAWRCVKTRFSVEIHAEAVSRMLEAVVAESPRRWPTDLPCVFSPSDGLCSGTVPADAARRLSRILEGLAGRRIIIHGAGEHTRRLLPIFEGSPATILAIADDDPSRHGARLGPWTIIDPARAGAAHATDVVISSWLHESDIWARRSMYRGMAVHRLYAA